VRPALERGVAFLLSEQAGDGMWRDFRTPAGEASAWPTGYIGLALHGAGADGGSLERAVEALLAEQNDDGGWGYNADVPSDADSTAWVLRFLSAMGHHDERCRQAASFLISHQRPGTGGIATYRRAGEIRRYMGVGRWMPFTGWCRPHTEVTAAAGCALAASPSGAGDAAVRSAWRHVEAQQRRDGSWDGYWWEAPHFATAQAAAFACRSGDRRAAVRAAEWALRHQNADGTWDATAQSRSAFATALGLAILSHAELRGQPVERAAAALVALQRHDGSWPCHPIMRIPLPFESRPGPRRWRPIEIAGGIVVEDQHRRFTSATCIAALALARTAGPQPTHRSTAASSGRG
jgi:squalene-hopene/tetraprenyl-beta-curcumene cyclase